MISPFVIKSEIAASFIPFSLGWALAWDVPSGGSEIPPCCYIDQNQPPPPMPARARASLPVSSNISAYVTERRTDEIRIMEYICTFHKNFRRAKQLDVVTLSRKFAASHAAPISILIIESLTCQMTTVRDKIFCSFTIYFTELLKI